MRLKSFRIQNYKSIIDSGECRLSETDNITILAGQNESGKSSILQALRDFENDELDIEALRDDDSRPSIICTYSDAKNTFDGLDSIFEDDTTPKTVLDYLNSLQEVQIKKQFESGTESIISLETIVHQKLENLYEAENSSIRDWNAVTSTNPNPDPRDEWIVEEVIADVADAIFRHAPKIIFFDDFCDLLPDKILMSDIIAKNKDAKGYQAVKNIETILDEDFVKLNNVPDGKRETTQAVFHETITAKFNEKWKQRIADGNGAQVHVKYYRDETGVPYLKFYIETKKGEFLAAGKRSQGFKWFLSFFLHLKAEDKRSGDLIILFDEPGLYLHSKAQSDMIGVFEELGEMDNQIMYSTHSPYLIDTAKLHRLRLVLNTQEFGTTIEKITSTKIGNQKDALKPIIDALGLDVASSFSVGQKNNVILEGISDFYYIQAMKTLFGKNYEVGLLPSMGSSNAHLLMELCIGWGLDWVIVFDDKGAVKDYNKIKKQFFNDREDEVSKRIYKLKGFDGIEDMFTIGDMKLVNAAAAFSTDKKNSLIVSENGGKELFARLFLEMVNNGIITKDNLSNTAIKNFEKVFEFIEKHFKLKGN